MKEIKQFTIERMSHEARGVAVDATGKTVFIDGALAGEIVNCEVRAQRRRFIDAKVIEVIKPSNWREQPKCAYFLTCGGCSVQHIVHVEQLRLKQQAFVEQLQHFGNVSPQQWLAPITGPIYAYRNKARLSVRYVHKKNKVLVGFRERKNSFIADIDTCEVLNPLVAKLILPLKNILMNLKARDKIAQIEVAVGSEQVALVLRNLIELGDTDRSCLQEFAALHAVELYLQPGKPDYLEKIYPANTPQRVYYFLKEYNLKIGLKPLEFSQINPQINEKMLNLAIELLQIKPEHKILDLFCGIGNFTLVLAKFAKHVTGIEVSDAMVARALENAKLNDIQNVEFFAADLTQEQSDASWSLHTFDSILLDPSRHGAKEILALIAKLNPKKIVYVSCNPATFARDAGILVHEHNYSLVKSGIMDMFPQTDHIETIALFERE